MNKAIAILAFLFIFSGTTQAQNKPLTLSGTIQNSDAETVYLQKFTNKIFETIDSATVQDGKFHFNTSVPLPELYGLTLNENKSPLYIFLEDQPITIVLDSAEYYKNTVIKGSKAQERFEDYRTRPTDLAIQEFIQEDPSSLVSAYVLYRNYAYRLSPQEILANVNLLDESLQNTQYVLVLKELAKTMAGVAAGKPAPDFVSTTPDGKTERFSDHFGKGYILLDFWASWCGPCRRENPNVVAAFDKFKDKGFTVYGVSLDKDKARWLKAIENDHLNWTQVSDLAFWNSEAAALYGVRAIPSNFLIDSNGEIIARDLKGDELHEKLEELLGE